MAADRSPHERSEMRELRAPGEDPGCRAGALIRATNSVCRRALAT